MDQPGPKRQAGAEGPTTKLPTGVGVALVTIFRPDGSVDIAETVRCAERCVVGGCTSVLVAGTTGEPWRLGARDRIELAAAVKTAIPDVFLFVGTGDADASVGLAITAEVAAERVADALLILSPTSGSLSNFHTSVADAADGCPVVAYHFPLMSPPGVDTTELHGLPVVGIKDSSADADRLATLITEGHAVYVGSSNLLLLAGRCGGQGALVSLANTEPRRCVQAWDGDHAAQAYLFAQHAESLRGFPSALKPEAFRDR